MPNTWQSMDYHRNQSIHVSLDSLTNYWSHPNWRDFSLLLFTNIQYQLSWKSFTSQMRALWPLELVTDKYDGWSLMLMWSLSSYFPASFNPLGNRNCCKTWDAGPTGGKGGLNQTLTFFWKLTVHMFTQLPRWLGPNIYLIMVLPLGQLHFCGREVPAQTYKWNF